MPGGISSREDEKIDVDTPVRVISNQMRLVIYTYNVRRGVHGVRFGHKVSQIENTYYGTYPGFF